MAAFDISAATRRASPSWATRDGVGDGPGAGDVDGDAGSGFAAPVRLPPWKSNQSNSPTVLSSQPKCRAARLSPIRKDGRPQSSDVHHAITDATIVFSVLPTRAKVFNIERDPRVVYHVSHEGSYLSFDGTAIVSPVATETHGPAMDILIEAYRASRQKGTPRLGRIP